MPALSQQPPHNYFAFVFLLPTPLLDLLCEQHCYICQLPFHTTSQNDAALLLTQQSQQQYRGGRPLLFTIEMLVAGVLPAKIHRVRCLVAICSRSPCSKTKVLFWPHHQQTDLTLPDYNNEGSPEEYAQPHCTSHRITTLATQS